jgi:hypothetical protein
MKADEYDVFMKDPSDFWLRRYLPRTFGILEPLKAWPHFMSVIGLTHTYTMTLARPDVQAMLQKLLDIGKELSEWTRATERIAMRGLSLGFPNWMGPMAIAPFDVIGDNLRGTTGIMMDIYRQPAKLLEALDEWAYRKGVKLNFIRPGKPIENALAESFNGRLRDECLNTNWFMNLKHAREVIEDWRRDYNEVRPHSSLKGSTPKEYAEITAGL